MGEYAEEAREGLQGARAAASDTVDDMKQRAQVGAGADGARGRDRDRVCWTWSTISCGKTAKRCLASIAVQRTSAHVARHRCAMQAYRQPPPLPRHVPHSLYHYRRHEQHCQFTLLPTYKTQETMHDARETVSSTAGAAGDRMREAAQVGWGAEAGWGEGHVSHNTRELCATGSWRLMRETA